MTFGNHARQWSIRTGWAGPSPAEKARNLAMSFMRAVGLQRLACECLSTRHVDMHHVDYSRPLWVAFLCRKCHRLEHAGRLQRPYRLYDLRELAREQGLAA